MAGFLQELAKNNTVTVSSRKKRAAADLEYFGREYLSHYFTRPSPPFHKELDSIWETGVLKGINPLKKEDASRINRLEGTHHVIATPRGHAKSTNLTFKDTLHSICYGYKHYVIILSDSSDQAEGFLDSIKTELEENEKLREDFGDLTGAVWRNNVIVTKTGVKVEAIGSDKKIRGRKHKNWRPDLIVLDDVENDENVRTPEQRKKLENWFYKAVSKAGDDYTDIIYIGTLLHYDSLLAKVLKNPSYKSIKYKAVLSFAKNQSYWDTWEKIYTDLDNDSREQVALFYFEQNKDIMLEGTQVLWEEKNSYYKLMVTKVSEGDASFNSELQNEPINPDDCIFQEEWFDYYNETEIDFNDRVFLFYGFIDPSLGKTKKSDYSAIITVAKNTKSGYIYVLDADIDRRHPDRIISDVINKQIWLKKTFGRGYKTIGAETNQFQWFLKEQLAKESAKQGVYLPIKEIQSSTDKIMRIETLQPDIKNKYIKFNKRHKVLLEQLAQFPMGAHDDGPDALHGAVSLAKAKNKLKIVDRRELGL
ncbi:MAG: Terminase-like family protein [Firmicutes bacterium ADurb.Bin193]|nr:MAG: Terminase-like family protein [Firmicutes bacterium ADurb.Bin193]